MSATENKWTVSENKTSDYYVINDGQGTNCLVFHTDAQFICDTLNRLESEAATLREEVKSEKEDREYLMRMIYHKNKVKELMQNDFMNLQSQIATLKAGLSAEEIEKFMSWLVDSNYIHMGGRLQFRDKDEYAEPSEVITAFRNRNGEGQGQDSPHPVNLP